MECSQRTLDISRRKILQHDIDILIVALRILLSVYIQLQVVNFVIYDHSKVTGVVYYTYVVRVSVSLLRHSANFGCRYIIAAFLMEILTASFLSSLQTRKFVNIERRIHRDITIFAYTVVVGVAEYLHCC